MTKASELSHSNRTIGGATPTTIPIGALQPRPRSLFMRWPAGSQEALVRDGKILANSTTERNLVYNIYRDYDPALGRYVESDPLGIEPSPNTYVYVGSNPLGLSDPGGLAPAPNGNYSPGFTPQDGICTVPGAVGRSMNANFCILSCCKVHDNCYTKYGCNSSSWRGLIPPGYNGPCQACNLAVVNCILNVSSDGCDPITGCPGRRTPPGSSGSRF
jgi:RHS repeat-associated protein